MAVNSFQFIWLFPIIFIGYALLQLIRKTALSRRAANFFLLVVSYLLYFQWNSVWWLLLLGVTAITFTGALAVDRANPVHRRKWLIATFATLALLPMLLFKYYDFVHYQVGQLMSAFNIAFTLSGLNWVIPIGISFYSLQAVGYLFDVYYRRVEPERNWWDYMLFVSFFPQIMAGPISRYADLMPQIKAQRQFSYPQAVTGLRLLLWGLFLKLVFADRLGVYVNMAIPNYEHFSGGACALGVLCYSLQIYGDFAGYSLMAVGVGKLLGFNLINNFHRPYFSASITEFWHRWHISLTRWLTWYVYIPLGGSRCSKAKTYRNIIITFLVSGLWHGANWTYLFWGLMHGALQVVEKALGAAKVSSPKARAWRIPLVFAAVTLLWVFFRVPTIADGFALIAKMATDFTYSAAEVSNSDILLMAAATAIVLAKEATREFFPRFHPLRHRALRWGAYLALLAMILMCGVLNSDEFIYVNF